MYVVCRYTVQSAKRKVSFAFVWVNRQWFDFEYPLFGVTVPLVLAATSRVETLIFINRIKIFDLFNVNITLALSLYRNRKKYVTEQYKKKLRTNFLTYNGNSLFCVNNDMNTTYESENDKRASPVKKNWYIFVFNFFYWWLIMHFIFKRFLVPHFVMPLTQIQSSAYASRSPTFSCYKKYTCYNNRTFDN